MADQRTLVIVDDEGLLDEVLRLAAAAECSVERASDPTAARATWSSAPLVVLDETALTACRENGLPRPSRLLVVCATRPHEQTWQDAFALGADAVVTLPADEAAMVAAFADVVEGPRTGDGRVLGVVGGRGGAGASVFAASVAVTAARFGGSPLLIDCDRLSGGIDLVLGAELDSGLRWPELELSSGRVSMSALKEALPVVECEPGKLTLLSGGRGGGHPEPDAVAAVVDAGIRAGATVVCDLPRVLDDVGCQVAQRAGLVVVVVPAEVRACASAKRVVEQFVGRASRVELVVRGPSPDGLPADAIGDAVDAGVLTVMRAEPRLAPELERAEFTVRPKGPLARAATEVLEQLWWTEPGLEAA